MLTRKYLKTIIVNLSVNYYQFKGCVLLGLEECAWRISNPNKIENDRFKWLRFVYYIKVYLSIGTLEFALTPNYTKKSEFCTPWCKTCGSWV